MKVFVVGANGQIGQHLIRLLNQTHEHSARAMVRSEEQAAALKTQGVETVIANLENSVDDLAVAATGCEAIVFTAGSGGHTGADKTLLVDLDGAIKTIEAARKTNIKRFVMVSALHADQRANWNGSMKPYYAAKHAADKMLEASTLNYTIVRPGGLLNDHGTGKVSVAKDIITGYIPREDVAATIVATLSEEHTFYRAFDLISGNIPIVDALKTI